MGYRAYPEYKESGVEWLGKVPTNWEVRRLKFIATHNDEILAEDTDGQHEIEYVDISSVDLMQGITSTETMPFEKAPSRARRVVKHGDTLVSTVRTYLKAIATINNPPENLIASTGFAVIRACDGMDAGFLSYYLQSQGFVDAVVSNSKGVSYPAINASDLACLPATYPTDKNEQANISKFLDYKAAQIDRLIEKKQVLIEKLQEQRIATITQAVTKGLASGIAIKESNNQWFDSIPAHWQVMRLKDLVVDAIAGPYGSSLTKSMYTNSGYRVYGQQQVIPEDFTIGDYYISDEKYEEMQRYRALPGDILISVMGTIGKAALVPDDAEPGIINPRLVLYRANEHIVRPEYLKNFINSQPSQNYFSLVAQGTTMEGINMALIGELAVAVPPLNEQDGILLAQQARTARLDKQAESVANAIQRLQEYRTALITAAVTGQIDVRTEPKE